MKAFAKEFVWGAASSAYQIEGAAFEDGKGPSIWDTFVRQPGRVFGGHRGDVACDHYHRFREDVALMRNMGLLAYRFSVSWPRVIPDGAGRVNAKGLAFYDRLVDELAAAGITPYVTLFHWDLPQALHERGGWLSRDTAESFARYAAIVSEKLGDRVKHWITLNEPTITILCGYVEGGLAPGLKYGPSDWLKSAHNLLLAHGLATRAIRRTVRGRVQVGLTHACAPAFPATESRADIAAAAKMTFDMPSLPDAGDLLHSSSWWMDPVYLGKYPAATVRQWRQWLDWMDPADLGTIAQDPDFIGLNIYHGKCARAGSRGPERIPWTPGRPYTLMNWPVTPETLRWGPRQFAGRYGNRPVYIFESGCSVTDVPDGTGCVHDGARIEYHRRYLQALHEAGEDGVKIAGYFAWSVMDVMEWSDGYRQKFGLAYVDHENGLRRIPKDSYAWYAGVIAERGACLRES